jgi:hypothetical protein
MGEKTSSSRRNAGSHNHRCSFLEGLSRQPRATSRPVVMGPGARPGRRACLLLDSTSNSPRLCERLRSNPSGRKEAMESSSQVRLAMTWRDGCAIPRRDAPGLCMSLPPQRGRGECRVPNAPAVSCAPGSGRTHTSNNEYTGIARHSRTQWFYGLFRALPGDRACLSPSSAELLPPT